jgi:hypothetical protein
VAEEQVIKLLEEIRDLQKMQVENYKDALKHLPESIDMQRRATRRHVFTSWAFGIGLVAFLVIEILSSH